LNLNDYYREMLEGEVIVSYKGAPSQPLFDGILSVADERLAALEQKSKIRKKVYHIMIEALQNVYHHTQGEGVQKSESPETVLFVLSKHTTGYEISTGNYIPTSLVATLQAHIERINRSSADEIKQLYREQLHGGEVSVKGGAGLGIIDIARRSGEKLVYAFEDTGEDNSFFSLKVKVSA